MTNQGLNYEIHVLTNCYLLFMRFIKLLRRAKKPEVIGLR